MVKMVLIGQLLSLYGYSFVTLSRPCLYFVYWYIHVYNSERSNRNKYHLMTLYKSEA